MRHFHRYLVILCASVVSVCAEFVAIEPAEATIKSTLSASDARTAEIEDLTLMLDSNWREQLLKRKYMVPSSIELESNIYATLQNLGWMVPLMIAAYLVIMVGLTMCTLQYLSFAQQNKRGLLPRRRRRICHLRQIQNQHL